MFVPAYGGQLTDCMSRPSATFAQGVTACPPDAPQKLIFSANPELKPEKLTLSCRSSNVSQGGS
jgi:hypothetical protein